VDIFYFYFFHEFALIATFIMVGVWGGRDRNYAAMMMTIYLTLGAMLSLAGLIAIHIKSGANNFDLITLRETLAAQPLPALVQKNIYGLLLLGFGTLVSLFPLHTWAPLGYGAAPSSAAMLHAGVLKKFGLYGLIQIALPLIPAGAAHWTHTLALLALCNVLIIGYVTIAQTDLKQMVGYSSVMHMGYAFLGIAAASTLGIGGVILLMIAHGLSVALLFLLATSIHHRTQTFDMTEMGGLAKQAPNLAALFVAATFASIGLPGFGNFWGELTIFIALWKYSQWMTIAAVAGIIISAIYGLRSTAKVFFGPPTEAYAKVAAARPPTDLRWPEKLPALILLAALLLLGLWPKLISDPLNAQLKSGTGCQPVGLKSSMGFQPMIPQAGGLTEHSRWLSEALRATPPENNNKNNTAPRRGARTRPESRDHLASLQDAIILVPEIRWYRSPSHAQPPAKLWQASGLQPPGLAARATQPAAPTN